MRNYFGRKLVAKVLMSFLLVISSIAVVARAQQGVAGDKSNSGGSRSSVRPSNSTLPRNGMPEERYFEQSGKSELMRTDCLLLVMDRIELAARRDGVLDELFVRMGDNVSQGDLLWEQSKKNALAELQVVDARNQQAEIKARNKSGVKVAEVEVERARKELALLNEVKAVPYLERYRAEMSRKRTDAELEIAKSTLLEDIQAARVTQAELRVAELDLQDRSLFAPVSGTIVEQFKYQGEWCKQGEPVLKLFRMDKLMLQGIVNIRELTPSQISGAKVRATFQIGNEAPISIEDLRVEKVSPEIDLDGNYVVWTFVDNQLVDTSSGSRQWLLRPGISGEMEVLLPVNNGPDSKRMISRRIQK